MQSASRYCRPYKPASVPEAAALDIELLFGGLHWRAERLIQATLEIRGYKARSLPPASKADRYAEARIV